MSLKVEDKNSAKPSKSSHPHIILLARHFCTFYRNTFALKKKEIETNGRTDRGRIIGNSAVKNHVMQF